MRRWTIRSPLAVVVNEVDMSRKSGFSSSLKQIPAKIWRFVKRQLAKLATLAFWKKLGLATGIVMACVGSWVTLGSFSMTQPLVQGVEKPVVRAWKAFNDDSYVCKPKKTYKKKKYSKKKRSKYSKRSKKRSGRYAKR